MNYYNASNNSNEREQFTKRTLGYHIIHIGIVREVMTISIESSI